MSGVGWRAYNLEFGSCGFRKGATSVRFLLGF